MSMAVEKGLVEVKGRTMRHFFTGHQDLVRRAGSHTETECFEHGVEVGYSQLIREAGLSVGLLQQNRQTGIAGSDKL